MSDGGRTEPDVVVAIPTYRRQEQLGQLLRSLLAGTEGVSGVRIDVLDNEPSEATRAVVDEFAASYPDIWIDYIQSPRPGIAAVRNHALERARAAEYLAFVDDDETVPKGWLRDLFDAAGIYEADVVVGPVRSRFSNPPAEWITEAAFAFDEPAVTSGTTLPWCATNNTLVNRKARALVPDGFSEAFSATGGSDNHFFFRATVGGAKIVWTEQPAVDEVVADSRVNVRWLLRRAYRGGAVRSRVEVDVLGHGRPRLQRWALLRIAKGLGGVTVGMVRFGVASLRRDRPTAMAGALQLAAGAGTLGGFVGLYGIDYKRSVG